MKKRFDELLRRGFALLLCLCVVVGYVPVPTFAEVDPHHPVHTADCGYAEAVPASPCTHEHGDLCYTYNTACTHVHGPECCSDPESGVADACAHSCSEATGCVTRVLSCTHVHDAACGYNPGAEARPCTFVCTEDHGTAVTEAPTEAPTEATTEEATEAPTEEPTEPEDTLVLAWSWVDSLQALTPDTGVLALAADPEYPLSFENVLTCLPAAVLADTEAGEQTLPVAAWHCDEYPVEGAYEGAYTFVADLPQGYALAPNVPALTVPVLFAQPVTLEQEYEASIVNRNYATLEEAISAAYDGDVIELLTNITASAERVLKVNRQISLDLNGFTIGQNVRIEINAGAELALYSNASEINPVNATIVVKQGATLFASSPTLELSAVQLASGATLVYHWGTIRNLCLTGFGSDYNLTLASGVAYSTIGKISAENRELTVGDLLKNHPGLYLRYGNGSVLPNSMKLSAIGAECTNFWVGECPHDDRQAPIGQCDVCGKALEARVDNDLYYESLAKALDAASSGSTVTLLKDCDLSTTLGYFPLQGNKPITINLNGHTLSGNIQLHAANLTINGSAPDSKMNGSIRCTWLDRLTINGGTYTNNTGSFLTVDSIDTLTITAGEFIGGTYALELYSRQIGEDSLFLQRDITGGTFHGIYDVNSQETRCRPDGYCFNVGAQKLKLEDVHDRRTETLTIEKCTEHVYENGKSCVYCGLEKQVEYVAQVGDENYYETFEAAVEAASAVGGTVKLIKDCAISNAVTVNSSITIDLNGKRVTTSGTKFKINGGKVTITSSTDTGRIYGDKGNAVTLSGGALTVNAGVVLQGYGGSTGYAVSVSGGDLILNQGVILLYGIKTTAGVGGIREYLASGTAFAEYDSATAAGSLVNGYTTKDYSGDLIVVEHTSHDYNDIGECACGFVCPHTEWDENGVCTVCEKTAAAALTVNGQTEFFMNATAALDKAQQSTGEVTLKLLKDVRFNGSTYSVTRGTFTVDLNGYALGNGATGDTEINGANVTVVSSAERAIGRYSDFYINSGKLTFNLSNTFNIGHLSVQGGEVTISGGNFYDTTGVNLYGGTVRISGGVFEQTYINNNADVKISGGTFRELRLEDGRTLKDILAKNKAFAREDGTELALTLTEFMEWNNVTVRDHVHNMENNKCTICGTTCYHKDDSVDYGDAITGKCTKCGALIYGASLQQGGSSAEGFDTLEEALKEYQKLPIDEPVTLRLFKTFSDPFASAFSVNAPLVIEGVCGNGFACHGITVEAGRSLTMNLHGLGYVSDGTFDVSGSLTVNSGNITCSGTSLTLNNGAIFTMNGGKIEGYNANDDAVTLNDGSTFTMTDGNVSVLKVAGAATVNISGGQVSTLDALASAAEDAAVELSGGTFGTIRTYGTGTVKDWLKSQYAFWSGSTPVDRSVLTASHELTNVSVALCDSHAFSSGVCRYCGYPCTHPDVVNNQCMTCHAMIYARITAGETVTYYDSVISAFEALNKITESPVTLAILGTPAVNKQLEVSKTVTLDLSGGSITKETEMDGGSYALEVCSGANLTITGSGAVKCTADGIKGNGILVSGGSLNVQGGEFGVAGSGRYGLVVNGGTVRLSGGTFYGIDASPKATGGLPALLAPGYAYFYDAEGKNVVESTFNGHPLYLANATLYVLPHTHDFGTTGVCACGVAYVVKLTANGQDRFYTDFLEAYRATAPYTSATLQLLRDVDIGKTFIGGATDQQSDNLTLDLNGHTLTGSDSDVLYVGNRRTVILMDSSGNNTGSIKNTSKGPAVSVGNLAKATIESGTYSPYVSVEREGGATLTISGGVFQPDGQMSALACSNGNLGSTATLRDLLPAGKTLAYDPNGTELVDVYAIAQAGENAGAYIATAGGRTVYVVSHTQHSVDTSTGKCGCGYAPVAAVMAGESVAYFDTFDAAVTEAQKTSGSTLTLMQDVTLTGEDGKLSIESGTFTIDWNGHTLRGETGTNLLTVTGSAAITLTGTGGVTNSGEYSGPAVSFEGTGSLSIQGGTYSPQVKKTEKATGTMQISGGVFQNPAGSGSSYALYTKKGTLSEMLADGYAFVYQNDDSVVSSYTVSNTAPYETVIVGTHEHTLDETGRCNCACGLICEQKDLDENGYCKTCNYTFVARTGVVIRWPFVSRRLFEQGRFNDAVTYILENAPQDSNDWSDLELLSDTVYSGTDDWSHNIDLYLHGHTLTLDSDIVVNSHVLTIKGGQGGTIATNSGALTISGGGMLNVEANFSGTLDMVELGSNGALIVKEDSTPHIGYLELAAGATARLAGGTYEDIINATGDAITLGSLLYPGYAFQSIDGTENYKYNEAFLDLSDVKVVKCKHGEYIDGHCVYCNAECAHKAPADMTDPKCPDCGIPIVASVTFEGNVTYYTSVSAALTQAASCTSESGSAATLALLRDADLTETVTVHGKVPITLDLNGHSLTAQNGAQIILEDTGADYPLVTFTDSNPNTNKSDVTVAVDHVRGGNARSVSVISGHWGTFNVKGHLTMSGGEVDVIDLDAEGVDIQPTAQISAGTVRRLDFDGKSKVTLTGGRYGRIYAAVQSTAFNYTTLLGDGNYAFAFTNVSGENRPPYAIMKDGVGGVLSVEVVKCGTDQYPHVYKDADGKPSEACLYCNYQCKHTQVDETTFTCGECGLTMEASVTQGSETRYFWHYCDAHADAGDAKNAEAGEATLKLLKDAVCNDDQRFDKNVTLDLNGYDITGTSGYSTSVGVTLTLTDSSSGDEAKWGTCGLVIGAGGLKGQISKVVVKSGNWSNLVVNNDTDITMTGGSVTFLEFLGTGAENSTISGGTVGRLRVYNANIKLSGGTFVAITYPKTYTESVATADLLAEKCAFAQKDSQGEWQRLEHKNLPTLGTGGDLKNVTVVQCGIGEYLHGFVDGVCKYCNYQCPHTDINPVTGKCKTCQYQMVASVTKGYGPIAYYGDFASAMEAATASGDDGRLLTLLDNASVGSGDWTVPSRVQLIIDLNGKQLTGSGLDDSRNISVSTTAVLQLTDNTGKGSALAGVSVNVEGGAVAVGSGTWWWDITAQDGSIVNIMGGNMLEGSVTQKSGGKVNVTESAADTWIGSLYVIDADKVSLAGGKYGSIKKTEDIPATSIPAKNLLADGYTYANTSGRLGYNAYKGTDFIIPTVTMSSVFVVKCDPHRYNNTGLCIYCNYQCPHTNVDPATGVCGTCNMQFAATVTQNGVTKCYVTLPEAVTAVNSATGTGDITLKLVDGCDLAESLTFTKSVTLDLNGKTITDNKKFLVAGKDVTLTLTDTVENSTASGGRIDGKEGSAIVVESGTWDDVRANGNLRMDNGRVEALAIFGSDEMASNVSVEIRGGSVDRLLVERSTGILLKGGVFKEMGTLSVEDVPSTKLLAEGYAFSSDGQLTGRLNYTSMPRLYTYPIATVNAYVVECTSHVYDGNTGFCIYCNYQCPHTDIDPVTGKCKTCNYQMVASVTKGYGQIAYYGDFASAMEDAIKTPGSLGEGRLLTLLSDASADGDWTVPNGLVLFIDLNGKKLTGGESSGKITVGSKQAFLNLTDNTDKGTATGLKVEAAQNGGVVVASGTWNCDITTISGGRVTVTGGSMPQGSVTQNVGGIVSVTALPATVINSLSVVDADRVTLSGGSYESIRSPYHAGVLVRELLASAPDENTYYAYAQPFPNHSKRLRYGSYENLRVADNTSTVFYGVSVVECKPHDFDGTVNCIYCNYECDHEYNGIGECTKCGSKAQASVTTTSGVTTYYTAFNAALAAAVTSDGCTLTLLENPKFKGEYTQTTGSFTLNLNSKELAYNGSDSEWRIGAGASVKFVGDGNVNVSIFLKADAGSDQAASGTAFYGGTYSEIYEQAKSKYLKVLSEQNHFAFKDWDGRWVDLANSTGSFDSLTATAVPYVDVQPANASVSYGADQLPTELTNLTASFESDWTVSAAWYYKNASGQWVAITDSKTLTSGTAYGAQQFDNTGFIVGQYTLRCDLTATKQGFPEFKVSSNEVTLTVTEAAPTFTAPKAATNLAYNGAAQALVSAGETGDGTLMYSNSQDGTYSADIPTGTDAGTYQVWYKVVGDGNHSDSTPAKLDVTIAKAQASSVEIRLTNELTYNGTKQTQNVEIWLGNHNVTDQFEITGNQQTAAGDYILSISAAANGNFDGFESTWWKIAPKNISGATINLGEALTYKGREQTQTVTSVTVDGLDVTYTVSDNVQTNAGTYTLTVTGTGNFTGTATKDWTIAPKDISNAVITLGDTLTYNGQEQTQTVTSVTVDGLSVTYDVTGNTGTDVKDYTLTITGTGNFTGTATKDWTIAPKDISNAIITLGEALTYNGQEQVQTIDSVTVDDLTVTYDASNDRGTNAGAYTLTVTGTGNFTGAATAKFTIAQREVTITNAAVDTSKVYDGNTSARIAYAGIISNKVPNDDVKIVQGTAAYGDKNVGTAKTVTFTGFTLDGSAAANYILTGQPADTLADITAREITVTATVKEKAFDGTTNAELASATLDNVVSGDDVKLTGGKPTLAGVTPGTQNVTFEDFVLEGADAGNYHLTNPQPEGVTATVTANSGYLDLTDESDFDGQTDVSIDGDRYPIQEEGEKRYVTLPASCGLLTIYTYVSGDATASHTNYPTSMRVYRVLREDTGATVEHIPELDDLLIYNGCSIRVTGKQGIRMITGISKSNKAALTGSGLAGYTLVEYGTVVCWADGLPAGETLTLGKSCARSNFAYRRGVSDPVFAQSGAAMQYTNVLVGFGLDQCSRDLIMRPYITLRDAGGATVTLYGGSVQRSIGYIATQNRTVFPAGTPAYEYVWNIIHAVYGDAYDSDYQG